MSSADEGDDSVREKQMRGHFYLREHKRCSDEVFSGPKFPFKGLGVNRYEGQSRRTDVSP